MVNQLAVLPDHRRVQALLDRGPHRERRREDLVAVVVGHHEVGAVAGAELVDLAEQVVGGVPREHVGQPGLDADADQRQPAGRLPLPRHRELLVAELHAGLLVRRLGVRLRQRHRHVEVVGAGLEGAVEDRHVEDRVDRVHHVRDRVLAAQRRHRRRRRTRRPARRRTARRRPPPSRPGPGRSRRSRSPRRSRAGRRWRRTPRRRRRRRPAGSSWVLFRGCGGFETVLRAPQPPRVGG